MPNVHSASKRTSFPNGWQKVPLPILMYGSIFFPKYLETRTSSFMRDTIHEMGYLNYINLILRDSMEVNAFM